MTTSLPRHPAFLSLQGGINFRDLGGQRAVDGRTGTQRQAATLRAR